MYSQVLEVLCNITASSCIIIYFQPLLAAVCFTTCMSWCCISSVKPYVGVSLTFQRHLQAFLVTGRHRTCRWRPRRGDGTKARGECPGGRWLQCCCRVCTTVKWFDFTVCKMATDVYGFVTGKMWQDCWWPRVMVMWVWPWMRRCCSQCMVWTWHCQSCVTSALESSTTSPSLMPTWQHISGWL